MRSKLAVSALALAVAISAAAFAANQAGASGNPSNAHAAKATTVGLRSTKLGKILVNSSTGHTLYLYTKDGHNKSNCSGSCATFWPPLLTSAKPLAGKGVSASKLGEIKSGKSHQVTYAGHPLYGFKSDTKAGSTTGEGATVSGGKFYVVSASGSAIK